MDNFFTTVKSRIFNLQAKFVKFVLFISLIIFLTAFNFRDVMIGSWNPQYIYNTNGQSIRDMAFADSLNGYITLRSNTTGKGTILKTTNGGSNWFTSYHTLDSGIFSNIKIFNKDSSLVCNAYRIYKTTNGGINWSYINPPDILGTYYIYAFNFDTIWVGGQTGFNDPHLWLSTNGGINWITKFQQPSGLQFNVIYFYNRRIGYCGSDIGIFKTTNGGDNWFQVSNEASTQKLQFTDSLTGWKCDYAARLMKKTTNGGYNWITQNLPSGHNILYSQMFDFSILNKDTIWGCGGNIASPSPIKVSAIIWKTTNGGLNWGYQLPDTNIIKFGRYGKIYFLNKTIGWVYCPDSNSYSRMGGVHTTTGGLDSTIYVGIKQQSSNVSSDFILYQNFPNPFNPSTSIRYKVESSKQIRLVVYDILGKVINMLVNEKKKAGEYEVKFDGSNLPSGVYFYVLFADGIRADTKKMLMAK